MTKKINSVTDLKPLIHENSIFFDSLVESIPARFYLPTDDREKPWFQGLSRSAKASAKKESRENIKKARRDRLDPEKSSTTLDLLKKSIDAEREKRQNAEGVEAGENRTVTYEELRTRLRQKIDQLRSNRNAKSDENQDPAQEKKSGKRKREGEKEQKKVKLKLKEDEEEEEEEEEKKELDPSSVDLTFGYVKIDDGKRKRKGLSKEKQLAKAEKLKEAKMDPEKGEIVSKKHSWSAAVSRATGVKVHDDPRILKESMRKEKKLREKHSEQWKERKETVNKLKSDRQKKRSDNISEKTQQKKARKIAKREKKLTRQSSGSKE